jgi:ATP-dependent DNA helicase 2 subunit 1
VQVTRAHKRILILTNNDTPFNAADAGSRARAVQKGRDLRDLDIKPELIAVGKKPGPDGRAPKAFNPLLFFKDILIWDESDSADDLLSRSRTSFADLSAEVFRKSMKKRALGSIKMQLGPGVELGVKLYCMLKEARRESAVYLDKETNERLETQTRWLDTNTGSVLADREISRYYPYGGVQVEISAAEQKELKVLGDPGLLLMGFKPFDALKVHHNIKSAYFVYPVRRTA